MAGGSLGRMVSYNGKTGGTPGPAGITPLRVEIASPYRNAILSSTFTPRATAAAKRPSWARRLSLRHLSGAGDLRVYLNDQADYFTLKAGESWDSGEAQVTSFSLIASVGAVEWEGTAAVA